MAGCQGLALSRMLPTVPKHSGIRYYCIMKSIVITPKDANELKFVSELLKKLGISSRVLNEEEQEDIGMSILMEKVDRTSKVSKEEIMKKLNS